MRRIRKSTIAGIIGFVALGALAYFGLSTVLAGAVFQATKSVLFGAAVLGGVGGLGWGVFTGAAVTTRYFKRRGAEKTQAKGIARMVENYQGNVRDNQNVYTLSKNLTKAMAYSAENDQSGMIGSRSVIGETAEQTNLRNKVEAFGARRDFFNSTNRGGVHNSRVYDKKVLKAEAKLGQISSQTMAPIDRRYSYTVEVPDPYNNQIYYDHRNEIMCLSSETREKYKQIVNRDTGRTSSKYYADFGYQSTLKFATNETLKDTCVKSNVEPSMEKYELLLLEEVKSEIEKLGKADGVFPIRLERKHYITHSRARSSVTAILNMDDLNKRIEAIKGHLLDSDNVKVTGTNFVNRQYSIKEPTAERADDDGIVLGR